MNAIFEQLNVTEIEEAVVKTTNLYRKMKKQMELEIGRRTSEGQRRLSTTTEEVPICDF